MLTITAIYLVVFNISSPEIGGEYESNNDAPASAEGDYPFRQDITVSLPAFAENSAAISADAVSSDFVALVDVTTGEIIASRKATSDIYPASMTKVMSLIVVFENLKNEDSLNDKITVTQEYYDRKVNEKHSGDLNTVGEELTVKDMIYAMILKSDGIAALALADYIAGSETAFVQMMNAKADEMGLESTSFTNCTGIHHKYHITSCQDMATIMMYAMQNTFCAEVLSAKSYRTTTNIHSDGLTFYHGVLVTKMENECPIRLTSSTVTAGKSGWTGDDSGRCLVSFATGDNGHRYVLVTAKAVAKNDEIVDLGYILNTYVK
jgi:D-alanyl-D-alanine carboxypeptidase (penicillin-binding protein 5/6)